MRLRFYLCFLLFLSASTLFGQTITYTDDFQLTPVTLTKDVGLINGKVAYTGIGTDKLNNTWTYVLRWCSNYHNLGYGAWIIGGLEDLSSGDCFVGNPYFFNQRATMVPPGKDTGGWEKPGTNIVATPGTGPLNLSGTGIYGAPTIASTTTKSQVASITAVLGGEVLLDGGETTTRGVVYNTSTNPTLTNSNTTMGTGLGLFSQSVSGLIPTTTYFAKAYATNTYTNSLGTSFTGTVYGNEISFVTETPVITATNTSTVSSSTFGTASASPGSFTVSGANMAAGILISPPSGFEVSLDSGGPYTPTITVGNSGTISNTTIYVRLTATVGAGTYSGNINLTSGYAVAKTSTIGSTTVSTYPITIKANNISKNYGVLLTTSTGSTAFTISSGTLQNGNTISSISLTPGTGAAANANVNTYTGTLAPSSAVGANGFLTSNYNITYTGGDITVDPITLTYLATTASRIYGAANPIFSGAVTGFANGESQASATTGTLAFATGATATSNVGTYAINGSGLTANNGNYTFVQALANATRLSVTPATLTYIADPASRSYGSANPIFTGLVTGFFNGENQGSATIGTLAFASAAIATSNVGDYAVNGSGLTASNGNYVFVQAPANTIKLTITPATLTYNATSASRGYGSTNPLFTGSVTGFVNGQTQATEITGTIAFTTSATSSSNVGNYAMNGSGLSVNNGNYVLVQATGNATALSITPATLTYLATTASRIYGAANPIFSGAVTGFANGETQASATTGTLAFATGATATSNVGTYAINGSGLTANNGNYIFVQANVNSTALSINPAVLTYSASLKSRTYGSADPAFAGTLTGFANGETQAGATTGTLIFTTTTTSMSNVGNYAITGAGLTANNGNYTFMQNIGNSTSFSITQAMLTYAANTASKTYGSVNPVFSGTLSGFVNGETQATATTGTLTFTTIATATSNVGTYAINGSGLTANNGNYAFLQTGTNSSAFTINSATLIYVANTASRAYGDVNPAFSGTVTGFVNGETQATATTGTLIFTSTANSTSNVGNYAVTGTGLSADNYIFSQATGNSTALTVDKAVVTLTLNNLTPTYDGTAKPVTVTTNPAGLSGITITYDGNTTLPILAGTYSVVASLTNSNYIANNVNGSLIIGKASTTLILSNLTSTYDGTAKSATVTTNPIGLTGITLTYNGNTTLPTQAGTYAVIAHLDHVNYIAVDATGNLVIDKLAIAVSATAKSKIYGDGDPALTYTFTPTLVTGEVFTGNISRVLGENIGNYAIGQGTLALNSNYTLNYTAADLVIGKQTIAVVAVAKSKTYGDADPALTYTFTPALVAGDSFNGDISRAAGENIGNYVIGQGSLALSNNYYLTYTGSNLSIGKQTIAVSAVVKSKTYGDIDPALTYTFTPALVTGDSFTGDISRALGENIGNYVIGQGSLALSNNYILTYTGANLSIGKQTIAVSTVAKSKTYGDIDPVLTYTFTPALVTGDSFTGDISRALGENIGNYAIGQGSLALSNNYTLTYTGANLSIGKQTIAVVAVAKNKIYGDADPVLTYTFTPVLAAGDSFTGNISRAVGDNIGNYAIGQSTLALNSNYTLNYTGADLVIGKQTIAVVAVAKNKTYGAADPALTYTFTPALVTGDSFTGDISRAAGDNIGNYAIGQGSLALSNNYILTYTGTDLSIGKQIIAVSAVAKSKTYGDIDPTLTYTFTPALITGDSFTGDISRADGENIGNYAIGQGTLVLSNNYTLNYTGADLSIGRQTIAVVAVAKSKTYGDNDPALTYTFTPALATGDSFTGDISRAVGESIGTYAIGQGSLVLNNNYILTYTGANLSIGKQTIAVVAVAKSKIYGDNDPALTYTFTPALATGDSFSGDISRAVGESIGNYAIGQGNLTLSNNYILTYTGANLSIGKQTIAVVAVAKSKIYRDVDPALTYTFTPALAAGDSFIGDISRAVGESIGNYAIGQGNLALSNNYILTYTGADLSIGKKTIAVVAVAKSKTYGDNDPALSYTFTPALAAGDSFTGDISRVVGDNIGNYAIGQGSLALSNNYTLTYTGANLSIGKQTIAVVAVAKNKIYGAADPVLTYTFTPALVTGDSFNGDISRALGENVGNYAIGQGTLALNSNYTLNYTGADLTIGKQTIVVVAVAKNKTYGAADPALTYTFTPALVTGDIFTGVLSRTTGENVASYAINKNTLALSNNYLLNFVSDNFVINKKQLTITADNKSKIFNDSNPILTASYSGFVGSETAAVLSTAIVLNTTATISSSPGIYTIDVSGATASNYNINFIQGTLTVAANSQIITFGTLADKLSTDAIFSLTASSSVGLAISYSSNDPTVARIINGNQVEILKPGTVNITASQAGNTNYATALAVTQTLKINDNSAFVIAISSSKGTTIGLGETTVLTARGGLIYQWATANGVISDQNTASLTVRPSTNTIYTVIGTNQYGRSITQTIEIKVAVDLQLITATNILSPNGDGMNDVWVVYNIDMYPNNMVTIVDRAGRPVFKVKGYKNNWDATLNGAQLKDGTYYYVIDFGILGKTSKKGFITIIR